MRVLYVCALFAFSNIITYNNRFFFVSFPVRVCVHMQNKNQQCTHTRISVWNKGSLQADLAVLAFISYVNYPNFTKYNEHTYQLCPLRQLFFFTKVFGLRPGMCECVCVYV